MVKRFGTVCSCLATLLLGLAAAVHGAGEVVPGVGDFLVAEESISDSRFRGGVVLVVKNNHEGSAGLVVNRQSRLPLAAVLPETSPLKDRGVMLSYGGPVEPEGLLALVKMAGLPPEPADIVLDDLYITGLSVLDSWAKPADPVPLFRAFTGYAGWAPGQLAVELARGDWRVVRGTAEMVFDRAPETLWQRLHDPTR